MSVLQTWLGLTTRTPHNKQVRIDLVFRVRTAGAGPRRHASQPHFLHQALHPLAIDGVAQALEENNHLAAIIKL